MEKNSIVMRVSHPVDKRTNLIFLTVKGKKMQVGMIEAAQNTIEDISKNIPKEDMDTFLAVLSQIDEI